MGDTLVQAGYGDFIDLPDDFMKDEANAEVVPYLIQAELPPEEDATATTDTPESTKTTTKSSKGGE